MKLKLLLSILLLCGCLSPPLYATFVVNSTADNSDATLDGTCDDGTGNCTLRAAIQEANNAGASCAITFSLPFSSTITLSSALPTITTPMTISDFTNSLTIDGVNTYNLFTIMGIDITFFGLTLANGGGFANGSAINNQDGNVTLSNSTLSNNTSSGFGGAIFNSANGVFSIEKSILDGNSSTSFLGGGAIVNTGTMTITESTVSNNSAGPRGGGIYNDGSLNIIASTFNGNSTTAATATDPSGGAIYGGASSTTVLVNSTLSGNTAGDGAGGGIGSTGTTILDNSTIVNNTANTGGGVDVRGGTLEMTSTIVANSIASAGSIQDLLVNSATNFLINDNNLVETCSSALSCPSFAVTADPELKALADNGGCTQTHLPCLTSPTIDAGQNGSAGSVDQRGLSAPVDYGVNPNVVDGNDIGAVELQDDELPVDLTYFTIRQIEEHILLTWHTASEFNNSGFEIQRSKNAIDWETLDFVKGHGTSLEEHSYKWLDKAILQGQSYYRLHQVDFDGQSMNSNIESIYNTKEGELSFSLFPNPAKDQVFFQFSEDDWSEEYCLILLHDGHGKLVKKWIRYDNTPLDVHYLPQGIYILSAHYGQHYFNELLIKQN